MHMFSTSLQYSPLLSRQELDQTLFHLFLDKESVDATFTPRLLVSETLRAAWFLLLARYAQADSLNIQTQNINKLQTKSSGTTILTLETGTPLKEVVQETKRLSGADICLTKDSVHAFPLAERHLANVGTDFQTAIVAAAHPMQRNKTSQILEQLRSCHIIVRHDLEKVSVWVDPRLSLAAEDPSLPRRLLSQLELIAQQLMCQHPSSSSSVVGDLDYFSPADQMDAAMHDPPFKPTVSELLHEMIALFAKSRANAPAICAWDADLTYQELDQLSTKLANQLVHAGVRPGTLVPLLFEKSAYTHVAQLAVLKAGGAFTTLPADTPLPRIKSIVAQLTPEGGADQPALGLCSPSLTNILAPFVSRVIVVDETSFVGTAESSEIEYVRAQPHDPAYVIFTSGTTGIPKGVVVEHRNICSSCRYFGGETMMLGRPGVRQSQFLSYAFDGSIHEIFYTLANGGCLCVLSEDERMNDIAGAMTRMGVTHAKFTPSIVDQLSPEDFPTVQKLFLGGESLTPACVDRWRPQVEVWNNYGPAECTVQSTVISCADPKWASGIIGHAGASRCFVIDPSNPHRRMPRGCIGEIVVEGPNVSRGYLRNPTETDRAFIQGLTWAPLRRFYRTGDIGYLDAYGLLTCKGRNDDQVKINGQRIELCEVETQLQSLLPGASRGVVDAINPSGRGKILVAFIKLDDSLVGHVSFEQLEGQVREGLVQVLPPAFVPSRILRVEEIPMGATGKTDRKVLHKLASEMLSELPSKQQQDAQTFTKDNVALVQFRDFKEKERLLRQMWADTLELPVETISLHSDFFQSGGSSLLAMRLAALARKQYWSLSVKDIFAHPILGEMVQAISSPRSSSTGSAHISSSFQLSSEVKFQVAQAWKIEMDAIQNIYPATAIQENFLALATTNQGAYIMQYTFAIPDGVNLLRLKESWRRVVEAHPILRTRFYHTIAGLSQVVLTEDFHWEERWEADSTDLRQRIKSDLLLPCQPLSRFNLLTDDGTSSHTLIWTVNHALTDGWTSSRLFAEVYAVYSRGVVVPPAEPYTSFVQASTAVPEGMEAFWQHELDQGPVIEYPILPYAQFRPDTNSRRAGRLSIASHPIISRHTVPMMVRAAWAITVSEMTQQEDVLFGVNLSGRHDCPDVVGPTVTTVPLRTPVRRSLSVGEFLDLLHAQSVRMMPFEQTGLRRIGEIAGGRLRPYCKFQNSLVVQLPRKDMVGALDSALNWMHPTWLDTVSAHGLVVNCLVESSAVEVWMNYDSRVLSEEDTYGLMNRFLGILSQVLSVEEGQTIAEVCAKVQGQQSNLYQAQSGRMIEYLGQAVNATRIESQILEILGIDQCACHVEPIRLDEQATYYILAAFIATDDVERFPRHITDLQSQMGKYLPNHMVPTRYFPLPTSEPLPTSQETLERIAWNYDSHLKSPSTAHTKPGHSSSALPTGLSPVEQILMDCWSQVLDRTDLTIHDSFLLLGGDSIKVMRLVAAARAANLRLSATFALQNPVFRRMAAGAEIIESQVIQEVQPWSLVGGKEALVGVRVLIKQQSGYDMDDLEDIFPVTAYQKSTFLDSLRTPGTCVLQTRYQLTREISFARMQRAWQQVCLQFPSLRTRLLRPEGWDMLQAVIPEATGPQMLHFPTLNHLQEHMQQTVLNMTQLGASLNEGLLALVGEGEGQERYLIWTIHHAVFDASTLQEVRRGLVEAYQGDVFSHQPAPLREYIGFLHGQDSLAAAKYWTRYLKGADASVFPHYPSPEYVVRPHATHRLVLTLHRPTRQSITMATMIHAAWGLVVASFTRTRNATYQHLLSGRTAAADKIDRFAGPTITLVPVRIKVQERLHSTMRGFLAEIQAQAAERMPHEGIGMENIASLTPEIARLCDFHHMLVIHSGGNGSEQQDGPIHKIEESMSLDGYLGLIVQCTISRFGVTVDLRWDEMLIPQTLINVLCARLSFLLRAMVEGDHSVLVGELHRQCFAL